MFNKSNLQVLLFFSELTQQIVTNVPEINDEHRSAINKISSITTDNGRVK